ncbi:MAG: hypothetical protein RID91_09235 [Azospirillaceae bacterium]
MPARPSAAVAGAFALLAVLAGGALAACAAGATVTASEGAASEGAAGERAAVGRAAADEPGAAAMTETGAPVTLSARASTVRVAPLRAAAGGEAALALRLRVERVENPAMAAVGIVATLGPPGNDAREIGRVYLFPPDRPGTFMLSLSPEEATALADPAAAATEAGALHLSLDIAEDIGATLSMTVTPALAR